MKYKVLASFFIFISLVACTKSDDTFSADTPLIQKYASIGSFSVEIIEIKNDVNENLYKIFLPKRMTSISPLIIWGNGSNAGPDKYDGIMKHLAQWGFVVVGTYSQDTGTGKEMNDALSYIVESQSDIDHILYKKIDLSSIATVGHSQGATGAINCQTNFSNSAMIKTVVAVALPALKWAKDEDKYDTSKLSGSFLVLGGMKDQLISPTKSNMKAIDLTNDIPALCLLLKKVGHNEIQGDGGKYRGLLTAWLQYQLYKDDVARSVFHGRIAEINKTEIIEEIFKNNF